MWITIRKYKGKWKIAEASGRLSAGGAFPAGVDFLNRKISGFFDLVTDRGQKLQ
jgi:hypothetical protein